MFSEDYNIKEKEYFVNVFNKNLKESPDKLFLSMDDEKGKTFSYTKSQFDEVSRRFYKYITDNGVSKESTVGLIFDNRFKLAVSILTCIRFGITFTIIAKDNPLKRSIYQIKDSNSSYIITDMKLEEDLINTVNNVIDYDKAIEYSKKQEQLPEMNPNDVACICYTSGTTGNPKGVEITYIALTNASINGNIYLNNSSDEYIVNAALSTKETFVAFLYILFYEIYSDYTIFITNNEETKNSPLFFDMLMKNKIEHTFLPPNSIDYYLNNIDNPYLKSITVGGDKVKITNYNKNIDVIVLYGLTETLPGISYYKLDSDIKPSCIGIPAINTKIYVLDDDFNQCGKNQIGQIALSGIQIAKNYINNIEETEKHFIDNPFFDEEVDEKYYQRLFLSGDYGYIGDDDNLYYTSRNDDQVQIRGQRVEINEITIKLDKIKEVKSSYVLVKNDEEDNTFLTCFYVSDTLSESELRDILNDELLDYMVPSFIIKLDEMPLNDHNKIDVKKLEQIDYKSDEIIEPSTVLESKLLELVSKVFKLPADSISIEDNFTNLGVDSIKYSILLEDISKEFGRRLSLNDLLTHNTIKSLAEYIENTQESSIDIVKPQVGDMFKLNSSAVSIVLDDLLKDKDDTYYNIPLAIHFTDKLDVDRLEKALSDVIDYQDLLKSKIIQKNNELYFKIFENPKIKFNVKNINENQLEEEYKAFVKPFDIFNDNLFRYKLLKIDDSYVLLLDVYHAIFDGESSKIFMENLLDFYNNADCEKKDLLNVNQYSLLEDDLSLKTKDYWDEYIKQIDDVVDLSYMKNNNDDIVPVSYFDLDKELVDELSDFCKSKNISRASFLLTCYQALLYKYSTQDSFTISMPFDGRDLYEIQGTVGMFVKNLPVIFKNQGSIDDILRLNNQTIINHKINQNCNLMDIHNSIPNDASSFFETSFAYLNTDKISDNDYPSLNYSVSELNEYKDVKDNLLFYFSDNDQQDISLRIETKLLSKNQLNNIYEHFINIIKYFIENSDKTIDDFSCITPKEKDIILNEFNDTFVDYPRDKTIVDLFEKAVEDNSDSIALTFEGGCLTYGELNERVNAFAHYVEKQIDLDNDDFIAIIANRSIEMIVGIYAALKLGVAYVPIDPEYPEDRIKYILGDCKPKAIFTYNLSKENESIFSNLEDQIYIFDLGDDDNYDRDVSNLNTSISSSNLAYCIYTSGTTGRPKGVMIQHKSVVNMNNYHKNKLKVSSSDNVLQFAPLVFDASVLEIYTAHLNGANLVLRKEDLTDFEKWFNENEISITLLPPNFFELNMNINPRILYTGGSASNLSITENNNADQYINAYGPTESTVITTEWFKPEDYIPKSNIIPIGKPLDNIKTYIIDKNINLCPIGVMGELAISGEGLAKGYLNRPDLTSEAFIDNPFAQGEYDKVLYKSGDYARFLPDGNIEFIGRIDDQVKIRGFRIELGEIENALRNIASIDDAVCIAIDENDGSKALSAYFVSDKELDIISIKEILSRELPNYMVPSFITQLDEIPLTINGKLDKKALPQPTVIRREFIEPSNDVEFKIADAFCEVLNLKEVSLIDNFLDLGGNSLNAMQLANIINSTFNVNIEIKDIFSYSTIQDLENLIKNNENDTEYEKIDLAEEEEYYDMSPSQFRTFLLDKIDDSSIAYNMPLAFKMEGELDVGKIKDSLIELTNRHEILRTKLLFVNEKPVQKILNNVDIDFEYIENTNLSDDELIQSFIRPFDLSNPPFFRCEIIKRNDYYLFLLDIHHIISDGHSMNIFFKELFDLYDGKQLKELPIQYKDYSEYINNLDLDKQRDYWLEQFSDDIPILDLPLDKIRPKVQSFKGKNKSFTIDDYLIKDLAKQYGATDFMVVLSIIYIFLSKYAGMDDINVGTPVSNRLNVELNDVLGMFVNTLALRSKVDVDCAFGDFLSQVKELVLNSYDNQQYPFEDLVEDLQVNRDMGRNPLFDCMVAFQNNENMNINIDNINVEREPVDFNVSKFDLTFNIEHLEDSYAIDVEYATDLFFDDSIDRLISNLDNLINNIYNNIDKPIKDIDIITTKERNIILNEFNNTYADYPRDKTLVDLFEKAVNENSDSVALTFENQSLTYGELNERANAFAHYLEKQINLDNNDFIAIIANRSIEMIVGIYAVLKLGAAYVPIDPEYPDERIKYILGNCESKAILTYDLSKERIEGVLSDLEVSVPIFDLGDKDNYDRDVSNLNKSISSSDLAYCIYTSGTTGRPKGVMIEHKSVVNLNNYQKNTLDVSSSDNVLQFAPLVFDASVLEIYTAHLNGATLVLRKDDLTDFEKWFNENEISYTLLPPNFFELNMDINPRVLFTGGSASNLSITENNIADQYINAYGPTESTVLTTEWFKPKDFIPKSNNIPIGKPLDNIKIYIVDKNINLCPIGVIGELAISGEGLAKGYLNRPDLTSEAFIDNPFTQDEYDKVLYKSGDYARFLPDGNIEFIGRIDDQVKIRGFRIELGEIENALRNIASIDDAVCIAIDDNDSGTKMLSAYFVSDEELDIISIKEILSKELPNYMVPSFITQLDEIPLTINGKLDKKALPKPTGIRREFIEPTTSMEVKIADAFCEVLNLKEVSLIDNFFDLGGNSLNAMQLANIINSTFNVNIEIKDIFSYSTIQDLENLIKNNENDTEYGKIKPAEDKEYYDMSPPQFRTFLLDKIDDSSIAYNMPLAFKIEGELDIDKIKNSLIELTNRHEILRTKLLFVDDNPVQKILNNVDIDFEYIQNTNLSDDDLILSFIRPFDLSNPPFFRCEIIKRNDYYLFLLDMHHIISDGHSMNIFFKELFDLYDGKQLKELPIQYKDYSEHINNLDLDKQRDYWLEQFSDDIPILDLPLDKIRPKIQSFKGSHKSFTIDDYLIKDLAKQYGATDFMVVLSIIYIFLSKYSGQNDIVVGTPISNRLDVELNNVLGMFVNTLALRSKIDVDSTYGDFLSQVKELVLNSYDNQQYPFENLVENLPLNRDMGRNPLFDCMISFQNNESLDINIDNINVEREPVDFNVSKFDISFNVEHLEDSYAIDVEYATDLFFDDSIDRLISNLDNLINNIYNNIDKPIKDIDIITTKEKDLILNDFNDTYVNYSRDITMVDLFEKAVNENADGPALTFENQSLTYGELNERANAFAHYVEKQMSIDNDDFIGIVANRSMEMIVAIYAVLKLGAAYVPINPEYPEERIRYILGDCKPKAIFTYGLTKEQESLLSDLELQVPIFDLGDEDNYDEDVSNLNTPISPSSLAYCIYTSGTTGRPKGVLIEHRNVVRLLFVENFGFDFTSDDVWILFHSFVFDFSVWEIFGSTLYGSNLIIPSNDDIKDFTKIADLIKNNHVTVLNQVPSSFYTLIPFLSDDIDVRYIVFGGEKLSPNRIKEFYQCRQPK